MQMFREMISEVKLGIFDDTTAILKLYGSESEFNSRNRRQEVFDINCCKKRSKVEHTESNYGLLY